MINTISDLLLNFKEKEKSLLKKYDIVHHPGIIGDMYEGLTIDILDKTIFEGLDLHVRAGKIKNSKNKFSGEIDCMIVIGNGEKIPHTNKYIYDSGKVIAVVQVKKNLYSKDIKDSYENLMTVKNVTELRDCEPYHQKLHLDSWRAICKEELPERSCLNELSPEKAMLYHILLLEAFLPARIVWGYNGFKSEYSLRNSFYKYLKNNSSDLVKTKRMGFGPLSLPNLIICDKYSLIKTNGIPYSLPLDNEYWWHFFVSSHKNPINYLLEIIWTRLDYMYNLPNEIFGEDLKIDAMNGFLKCKYKDKKGWEYNYIHLKTNNLNKPLVYKEWELTFLDEAQFVILSRLCNNEDVNCKKDEDTKICIKNNGYTIDTFINSLKDTGLVHNENGVLSLITDQCVCGISPDGRYFAGDNNSGRVTRWASKYINKNK